MPKTHKTTKKRLDTKPKPRGRKSSDVNQAAAQIVREATREEREKNPAAVLLGRLGGLKGGQARAAKLSAKRRSQIAKAAAKARWGSEK